MEQRFPSFAELGKKLEDELDMDFSVSEIRIDDIKRFNELIKEPFNAEFPKKNRRIFYRGERVDSPLRPLVPTLLRDKSRLLTAGEGVVEIDGDFLLRFYENMGEYLDIYRRVFGTATRYRLYELCAFSQHYLDVSPFIDFTKSLYVALSFALKGRSEFDEDIVLFTAEIADDDSYTNDIVTAECWLNSYRVTVYNDPKSLRDIGDIAPAVLRRARAVAQGEPLETAPKARLIDIPTNDFTKLQQGVFLLLTDFALVRRSYLTKSVREEFRINKYIIGRELCPQLSKMISSEAPWYEYPCLFDIKEAMRRAALKSPSA